MAPKSPRNKKTKNFTTKAQTAVPISNVTAAVLNYEEIQIDEIEALRAIYADDFEDAESKGAWSKTTDRSFKLKLRSLADHDTFVTLSATLTASYPRSAPILDVSGLGNFHERTQKRVRDIVQVKPRQLAGEAMIYAISSDIQDALEDAFQARQQGTLPSLEYERAAAEEHATILAQQAEEAEAQRRREVEQEEKRILDQMVHREISRREKQKPVQARVDIQNETSTGHALQLISFDQPAKVQVGSELESFREVSISTLLSSSPTETVHLATPLIRSGLSAPLLVLKRRTIRKNRGEIIELESILAGLCRLRHASLLHLFAFRVTKLEESSFELMLCLEYANRGSLYDLLSICQPNAAKARQWSIEMLEGLDYLHRNGVAHGNLGTRTIYISGHSMPTLKLVDVGYGRCLGSMDDDLPPNWRSPDDDSKELPVQCKSDVWDLGVVLVQMFLGLRVVKDYPSPFMLPVKLDLSEPFEDLLNKVFSGDRKKRFSAFDLLPVEFLRTDSQVLGSSSLNTVHHHHHPHQRHIPDHISPVKRRSRHNSSAILDSLSRYTTEFTDLGRLGKGGFGEVVKARNKLDGGVYAIKKIKQTPQLLDKVLSEVMLLNRLNHPYVVRYFSTWLESDAETAQDTDLTATEDTVSQASHIDFGFPSTGGLDFVSSSGYPEIEFADDEDEEDDGLRSREDDLEASENNGLASSESESSSEPSTRQTDGTLSTGAQDQRQAGNLRLQKSRSNSRRPLSVLYIQMELCDRRTLRDLILKRLSEDDAWRFIRQITEGLQHIHGHGIIHRDLKPDNVFVDPLGNPKIGDFGLATTSQHYIGDTPAGSKGHTNMDLTRSVGTALYVAPELQSSSVSSYNEKVDMYSLGIMFFEMNNPFGTAMERITELQSIRRKEHDLPIVFQANGEKSAQGRIITSLVSHKPSGRPSSTELIRQLPLKLEDETIQQALNGLSDANSPYHHTLMSALFSSGGQDAQRVRARAWGANSATTPEDSSRMRMKEVARGSLRAVFRRHGAEETARDGIFPRSGYYTNSNVVQLIDPAGNLLQLPYDLTLPYARQLSRQTCTVRCTYSIGCAYRDTLTGGPPRTSEEADFDIVNTDENHDTFVNDAEIIKVMDEILLALPNLNASNTILFHLNSASLLTAILEHCRVATAQHFVVIETLSKLGFHNWNWAKVRSELRNLGLSDTTLDDLSHFDFRDGVDKSFTRIRALMSTSSPRIINRAESGMQELRLIVEFTKKFGISHRVYIVPLSCFNAKFYSGMLFQCVLDRKSSRSVIAAGGRYDGLIRSQAASEGGQTKQGAVGVCIGIDTIAAHMLKATTGGGKGSFLKERGPLASVPKRCDVVVIASGSDALRNAGIKLLASLWSCGISTEMAANGTTVDEHSCAYIVTMRHEASTTVRVLNTETGIESPDIATLTLTSHILQELRDHESNKSRLPLLRNPSSHHNDNDRKHNVELLMARHGSKKSNKMQHVQDARKHWEQKLEQMKEAPILAVETRDDVLKTIQETRLSDAESWKKAVQSVNLNERQYLQQIQDRLDSWRHQWVGGDGVREICVYNFRTESCIYYDLGL